MLSYDAVQYALKLSLLESRSEWFCLRRTRVRGHMAAEEGDCEVQVANAITGEVLCTVLEVKRRVQATQGIGIFRQRLLVLPVEEED